MKRFVIALLAIALVGCDNNNAVGPNGELDAAFNLRTINGQTLPFPVNNNGLSVTSDVFTFFNDGTYSDVAQYNDNSLATEQGFYTNTNGAIDFQDSNTGVTFSGSLSGNVLTLFPNGFTEVFQRQ